MNTQVALQQQAISAAKDQNWQLALEANQAILDQNQADIGALNRLGVAQMQLGELSTAKQTFNKVLEIDKSNSIAKKHLTKLKSNQAPAVLSFHQVYFIEEPGKTKIAELHRLAGKQVLDSLSVGQLCELKPKNRYISIETDGTYIGALPEDLSFRLTKLITNGNTYLCYIHSLTSNSCNVYIKEEHRSEANQFIHSFPLVKNHLAAINDIDEEFLLDDDIPVEAADTETEAPEINEEEEKPFDLPDSSDE